MTYKERKVLVYDAELKKIKEFPMPNEMREGWGLKHFKDEKDSYYFYASDGTNQIFVIDPINWQVISINHV
jgi:glutamine cyclotransferase